MKSINDLLNQIIASYNELDDDPEVPTPYVLDMEEAHEEIVSRATPGLKDSAVRLVAAFRAEYVAILMNVGDFDAAYEHAKNVQNLRTEINWVAA